MVHKKICKKTRVVVGPSVVYRQTDSEKTSKSHEDKLFQQKQT